VTQRDRPVLLFDGDCGFCTRSAGWLRRVGIDADVTAWQFADIERYRISPAQAMSAVQWVGSDGSVRQGHAAIAAALGQGGFVLRILGKFIVIPGLSALSALTYRLVAKYRYRLPGGTPACAARPPVVGPY
jgi:predicted DCC family thiol-disulfide oxidoreductase YuxK